MIKWQVTREGWQQGSEFKAIFGCFPNLISLVWILPSPLVKPMITGTLGYNILDQKASWAMASWVIHGLSSVSSYRSVSRREHRPQKAQIWGHIILGFVGNWKGLQEPWGLVSASKSQHTDSQREGLQPCLFGGGGGKELLIPDFPRFIVLNHTHTTALAFESVQSPRRVGGVYRV